MMRKSWYPDIRGELVYGYGNHLQDDYELPRIGTTMTVCLAAICEHGKAVVMAADRSYSFGGLKPQPDSETKIFPIHAHAAIAVSRCPLGADAIAELIALGGDASAKAIAEKACDTIRLRWNLDIEQGVFQGSAKAMQTVMDALAMGERGFSELREKVQSLPCPSRVIVAGIENGEARLYKTKETILVPSPEDCPGYACIGDGEFFSVSNFNERSKNIKEMTLAKASYFVYEAKKWGEYMRGVGAPTNMAIITASGGFLFLDQAAINELDAVYQDLKPRQFSPDHEAAIRKALPSGS